MIIKETKLKFAGNFDFVLLYRSLQLFMQKKGFGAVKEKLYVEKVKPAGKFIEIVWETTKDEGAYFKWILEIKFFGIAVNDTEIDFEGKKVKAHKGELEIGFSATLVRNASNEWPDKSFKKRLYEKYIISDKIEQQKIDLHKNVTAIIDEVKRFLNVYRS